MRERLDTALVIKICGADVVSAVEFLSGKQLTGRFAILHMFTTVKGFFFLHREWKRPGICENLAEIGKHWSKKEE